MMKISPSDSFRFGKRMTTLLDAIPNIQLQEKPDSTGISAKYSVDIYENPKGMHCLSFELSREDFEQLRDKMLELRRFAG